MSDFMGFKFNKISSSELKITIHSNGDRFSKDLFPNFLDTTEERVGNDGVFYYGTKNSSKKFSINFFYDSLTEEDLKRLQETFKPSKISELIFDEYPYKIYQAKPESSVNLQYVSYIDKGIRYYKGDGTITFICYYPFAICKNKYLLTGSETYSNYYERLIYNKGKLYKGGYPTLEQSEQELLAMLPEKQLPIEEYYDNTFYWANSSGLLKTPFLDSENDFFYMPQFDKGVNTVVDLGYGNFDSNFGSRLLTYNSGDFKTNFELSLLLNEDLRVRRMFRIAYYDVDKILLEDAVDLGLMEPYDESYNLPAKKYQNIYLKREVYSTIEETFTETDIQRQPKYLYFTNPIPKDKLQYFIRKIALKNKEKPFFQTLLSLADEYETFIKENDDIVEFYWQTLKNTFDTYVQDLSNTYLYDGFSKPITFYDYISTDFNFAFLDNDDLKILNWIEKEFIDIDLEENVPEIKIDFEKQLIYTKSFDEVALEYKTILLNNAFYGGEWFSIERGFGLIQISLLDDIEKLLNRSWLNASNFQWGYPTISPSYTETPQEDWTIEQRFEKALSLARRDFNIDTTITQELIEEFQNRFYKFEAYEKLLDWNINITPTYPTDINLGNSKEISFYELLLFSFTRVARAGGYFNPNVSTQNYNDFFISNKDLTEEDYLRYGLIRYLSKNYLEYISILDGTDFKEWIDLLRQTMGLPYNNIYKFDNYKYTLNRNIAGGVTYEVKGRDGISSLDNLLTIICPTSSPLTERRYVRYNSLSNPQDKVLLLSETQPVSNYNTYRDMKAEFENIKINGTELAKERLAEILVEVEYIKTLVKNSLKGLAETINNEEQTLEYIKNKANYPSEFLYTEYKMNITFIKRIQKYYSALGGQIPYEWMWYATNYSWEEFPPVLDTSIDLIKGIGIDYNLLYY